MSKSHPEQWTVRPDVERPDRSLVTALREFATTQIAHPATGSNQGPGAALSSSRRNTSRRCSI